MWHPQILGHLECRPKIYYDIWSMAINSSKLSSFGIPVIPIKPNISVWNPFNNPYNRVYVGFWLKSQQIGNIFGE